MKSVNIFLLLMLKALVAPSVESEKNTEYIDLTQPTVLEEETHRELFHDSGLMGDHVSLAELVLQQREDMARLSSQFLQLQQSHHRLQDHVQDQSQELQELKDSRRADREVLDRQTWEITGLRRGMEERTREIQEMRGKNQQLEDIVQRQQHQILHLENSMQQQQQQQVLHLEDSMRRQQSDLARLMDKQESDLPRHVSQLNEQSHQMSGQEELPMAEARHFPQWKTNTSSAHDEMLRSQQKRADDTSPLEPVIGQMTQQLTQMTSDIEALKNTNDRQDADRGTSYIRWGHTACPNTAELVYSGILTGSLRTTTGGPANHLCMIKHPVYDNHVLPSGNPHTGIYGSEYEICPEAGCNTTPACSVCRVARASTVMIPGTNTCTPGWTLEYSGYIMAGWQGHPASSEYICVDSSLEYIPGTQQDESQNTIFYTSAQCGSLPCPSYQSERAVTCVVCSR